MSVVFDGPGDVIKFYKTKTLKEAVHSHNEGSSFSISVSEDDCQMTIAGSHGRILIDFPISKHFLEDSIKEFISREDFF